MFFKEDARRRKAVAYYRHSAEDKQENSVPLQRDFVHDLLRKNDIEIIHEEADEGVSGLTANRPGFNRLFKDWVLNPIAPRFDYVIVYDVSRWGRFEDADEAGYYEFQCKQSGKEVVYARRGFSTEEQRGMSQVQTAFERWMSFQYSKKLSEDVIRGCLEISSQGYSVGGQAPYGLARLLLSAGDRKPIRIMQDGEHKSVANERITFIPKGDYTTDTIKRIFDLFLAERLELEDIATKLNLENISSPKGSSWNKGGILRILSNPAYKGTSIYNKTWGRLHKKKRDNPISQWVICDNAFQAIISPEDFDIVQEQLYWLIPSRYRKGIHAICKAKKIIKTEFRALLSKNSLAPDYDCFLPIVFAVKRKTSKDGHYWCFCIPETLKEHKAVFCVSVNQNSIELIDTLFVIPTAEFDLHGMLLFSEKQDVFLRYEEKGENLEKLVIDIVQGKIEIR
jgi:DNA invertase Pin-like site-specific DNA recombinase